MTTERPYAPDADEPGDIDEEDYTWERMPDLIDTLIERRTGPGKSGPAAYLVELAELRSRAEKAESGRAVLLSAIETLTADRTRLVRENIDMADAYEMLQADSDMLRARAVGLKMEVEEMSQEVNRLRAQVPAATVCGHIRFIAEYVLAVPICEPHAHAVLRWLDATEAES